MDFLSIFQNFSLFSLSGLTEILTNPVNYGIILSLVVIEGLLSTDNALVLAIMVRHLPAKQQKKALFYGIIGAYTFRFIAIGLGTFLINLWWIKVLGAGYLLYLAISFFVKNKEPEEVVVQENNYGFWRTVLAVEMMDIAFSMDSVLAAFGVSNKVWVLYIGGILGIAMMRGVAQLFVKLLEKIPEFENTAYVIIAFIGIKMGLSVIGIEISGVMFIIIMAVIILSTLLVHYIKKYNMKAVRGEA